MTSVWKPITEAAQDGTAIWVCLGDGSIHKALWESFEMVQRRHPADGPWTERDSAWVAFHDRDWELEPVGFLPLEAIPDPPSFR